MRDKYLWLQMFAGDYPWDAAGTSEIHPVNVSTQESMKDTMKVFYSDYMLENTRENQVFAQFGKRERIHGNKVEWRKWNTFAKALTPLEEGVIPDGDKFGMTSMTAGTTQHGKYTVIADRLELEAYDDVIMGATEELSATKVATYDTLVRNVISAGNSVAFAPKVSGGIETPVQYRKDLDNTALLTSKLVNQIATWLKKNKAPKINGDYIGIIHPSQAYDLRQDQGWLDAHIYQNVTPLYNGEIGKLHGIRFIEATEAKVFRGADLTADSRNLTASSAVTADDDVPVNEAITADEATALVGREVLDASGNVYEIASATAGAAGYAAIKLTENITIAKDAALYPAGGGAQGSAVYVGLFFGKDAFAIVDPEGEGQQMYFKNKDEIGGPLEQFSTVGFKFVFGAKILYQERLLRVETGSYFGDVDEEN